MARGLNLVFYRTKFCRLKFGFI